MPTLQIRGVPEAVFETLKRRAARHQRSLQGELRHILEQIALTEPPEGETVPIELHMSEASRGDWNREEIYGDDGR
jgi:plasmid stability protein